MKRLYVSILISIFILVAPFHVLAAFIVDTGETTNVTTGSVLDSDQWLAGEFTIEKGYILTEIKGFLNSYGGTVGIAIYTDGGDIPDIENELYYDTFNVSYVEEEPWSDWYGLIGLNWYLPSGTYWVSFEVREGLYDGNMPIGPPIPLEHEAFRDGSGHYGTPGLWYPYDPIDMCLRIQGNAVPIPGAVWLLGSGLIGIVGIRRRFKK